MYILLNDGADLVRSNVKAITKSTSPPIDCQQQCSVNKKIHRKFQFFSKCRSIITLPNNWRRGLVMVKVVNSQ